MSRPAIPLVLTFMVGLFLGDSLPADGAPYIPYVLTLIFVALGVLYFLRPSLIFFWGAIFFLAVGVSQTSFFSPRYTEPPVPAFILDQRLHQFSGTLQQEPTYSADRTRLIVRLSATRLQEQEVPIQGIILLTVNGILDKLETGDPIRFVSRLHPIEGYHNPGGYDFQRVMAREGIRVAGFLEQPDLLVLSGSNNTLGKRLSFLAARFRVNALIDAHIPPR